MDVAESNKSIFKKYSKQMKILIDIGHPAHVHYFKNFYLIMSSKGHQFLFTARDKEIAHYLLQKYGIKYITRGSGSNNIFGKLFYILQADWTLYRIAKKFKPDIFLSFGSPYAAQVSYLLKKPNITFDDTENAKFGQAFYKPFTNCIITPNTFHPYFGYKHLKFDGYMELCYLHPKYFNPNSSILNAYNINTEAPFTVIRFVSWNANHDYGHAGISLKNKIKAVNEFAKYSNVYISSENSLPKELIKYKTNIPPEHIHHLLAFANLFYGESATMASESAVLGTPAVYVDNQGRGYTNELEKKYNIVFNYSEDHDEQLKSIEKGLEILKKDIQNSPYSQYQKAIINEKINVTDFMVWFIENFPQSFNKLKNDPAYQYNFK
jgi:hypothetical protein